MTLLDAKTTLTDAHAVLHPKELVEEDTLLADAAAPAANVRSRSYAGLVWRRFRRNPLGLIGLALVALLILTALFADFLSPYAPNARNADAIYLPPQDLNFRAEDGFHIIPFTHPITFDLDPNTFQLVPTVDTATRCQPAFLGKGWSYSFFGLSFERHLLAAPEGCSFHVLGTDRDGRDMLSRLLVGSRLTLLMAALVVTISVTVGTLVGILSGYLGGRGDEWIQRVVEFVLALPELPLYFALVVVIPRNTDALVVFFGLGLILSALRWAQLAREVRGKTLLVSRLDYIAAAEAIGASTPRILLKHILPNVLGHVIVSTTLMIPTIVLLESFLSFLGVGVRPPLVSWGMLLNAASDLQTLGSYPWVLVPIGAILVAVLGFNMLGDALRDAIDPYST
ncbi:ABC transporter permease [Aureimonas leprariae]|uniref:ABC transporter permease n=1 Tax=Plantimonas leprariae TaxID=2615207 RepID=A0A7V7PLX5_9HYPH|nr:ABC transporter permease [Aureimonas leprariae]KAB0677690.1 ABC transporter permease [Aureimonas leprariae]